MKWNQAKVASKLKKYWSSWQTFPEKMSLSVSNRAGSFSATTESWCPLHLWNFDLLLVCERWRGERYKIFITDNGHPSSDGNDQGVGICISAAFASQIIHWNFFPCVFNKDLQFTFFKGVHAVQTFQLSLSNGLRCSGTHVWCHHFSC